MFLTVVLFRDRQSWVYQLNIVFVPCCSMLASPSLCIAPYCFASALHLLWLQNMCAQPSQR